MERRSAVVQQSRCASAANMYACTTGLSTPADLTLLHFVRSTATARHVGTSVAVCGMIQAVSEAICSLLLLGRLRLRMLGVPRRGRLSLAALCNPPRHAHSPLTRLVPAGVARTPL